MQWWELRDGLIREFADWCEHFKANQNTKNLLEFLFARDYLKARKAVDEIGEKIKTPLIEKIEHKEFLREGFVPYKCIVRGRKEK